MTVLVLIVTALASAQAEDACCLPDGNCVDVVDEGECDRLGGTAAGGGRTCSVTPCPQPGDGACCTATIEGGCVQNISEAECAALPDGRWEGPGTNCDQNGVCVAVPTLGACCGDPFPAGCADGYGEQECLDSLGVFGGPDTTCNDTGVCGPTGACCLESTELPCVDDITEAQCTLLGGAWAGAATSCLVAGTCGQALPVGACCHESFPAGCVDQFTRAECDAVVGAAWAGSNTQCSIPGTCGPPPVGACCGQAVPNGCRDGVTEIQCAGDGQHWVGPGSDCAGVENCGEAPILGACCDMTLPLGCAIVAEGDCHGVFQLAAECTADADANGVPESCERIGDTDGDFDVDADDVAWVTFCITALGPGERASDECLVADFNLDGRVDLVDVKILQEAYDPRA